MHRHKPVLKQSNKPFKGKSSIKKKPCHKRVESNTNSVSKLLSGKNRENQKKQLRTNKIALNSLKKEKYVGDLETPLVCTIVPFNSQSNPNSFLAALSNYICCNYPENSNTEINIQNSQKGICTLNFSKYRLSICVASSHEILDSLDLIKCSDFIIALFGYNEDFQAFDEMGYKLLKSIKLQGQIDVIGAFSYNETPDFGNKILDCEKVFRRSFEMEFNKNTKFFSLHKENDVRNLISSIPNLNYTKLSFRDGRGYLISESSFIQANMDHHEKRNKLIVRGYVRGVGLSTDFPVHITGIGDFAIDNILPINYSNINSTNAYSRNTSKILINNELMTGELNVIKEKSYAFCSSCENHNQTDENMEIYTPDVCLVKNDEHKMHLEPNTTDLHDQQTDNYEDDSEISTDEKRVDFDTICRTRFSKYRGLESLRTSNWDPMEGLPNEYSNIFEIDSFKKAGDISRKIYADSCNRENYKGKYCEVILSPISSDALRVISDENISSRIIILSSILPFEEKIGVMNFRIKRTPENRDLIRNKTPLLLQAGFRRFYICPTISNYPRISSTITIERNQILKQCKILSHGDYYIITCYSKIIFPPCPILLFSINNNHLYNQNNKVIYHNFNPDHFIINEWPLAWGDIVDSDPYRVIVKRVVLIGNLFKVRKCKGIVRNMFNNPDDIKWFKSVGLRTRSGIRGIIKEPLGMHGHMKCLFSKPIQQNEVVGMPLYKRVFPKWFPITWFEGSHN
ncbi:hypothetical protein OJ252_3643 [Cryptosporidium canis]|uniref:Ribosome biogenesis protein BMS1/TSR1 C-terminal domain-containing protein n=1 Tax=Cryptosporidium canis TaxID=195482 RepID=A0ABQ8P2S5_9CRYT|nr:hypothetical protein OJ252_3643 [Cryptosporidium canis]